jgi:Zn-dependent metalloprotease
MVTGCFCFAVPPKMFRRLVERSSGAGGKHAKQHKHSTKLRSVRYGGHEAPAAPGTRSRKAARTVYDVAQGETLPGKLVRTEGGKPARDPAAEQAFDNAGIALAFFREVFGRNSVDGKGLPIISAVHYGREFQNAMWNGRQMIYGDGDEDIGNFTAALDIIAHELSHGVSQYLIPGGLGVERVPVADREFKEQRYMLTGQSGALNESFSDVMGSLVKQWHAGETAAQADWLMGEKILARGMGRAVRSLKSPGNERLTWRGDEQMRSMAQYYDGCDVHDASGIPNHAFYLTARKIGGHAWETSGRIWFDAYDSLHRKAQFADFAEATLRVAAKRHGAQSVEHKAVHAAWKKVQVLP